MFANEDEGFQELFDRSIQMSESKKPQGKMIRWALLMR